VVRASGGNAARFALGQDLAGSRLLDEIRAGRNSTFEEADETSGDSRLVTARSVRD